ncbi:3-hydroxy-fatty acyl-ACP dehydratase [Enterobacterales bacterium CwR94]|nr:3-hydroxy-fatty acyl-ACP dehydratase [Enterobacterales bacterium CwR94]
MTDYLSPGAYLPHEAPMLLLQDVLSVTDEQATCRVTVEAHGVLAPFLNAEGALPGWFALELMAQTVGVWSGWHRRQQGDTASELGMVLGARELSTSTPAFTAGSTLEITVTLLMQDQRFGSFDAQISADDNIVATGRINTFQPDAEALAQLFQQGGSV